MSILSDIHINLLDLFRLMFAYDISSSYIQYIHIIVFEVRFLQTEDSQAIFFAILLIDFKKST